METKKIKISDFKNEVKRILKESYYDDQIDKIIEPETEYQYKIILTNGGADKKTNYITISKDQLLEIKKILNK